MATTTVLQDELRHKHDELAGRLAQARSIIARPEQTRRGCPPIDQFNAGTSRHLHAVDEALLPAVSAHCEAGAELVHDYLPAARRLEVLLFHVKAHEYGSTWETTHDWPALWGEVEEALHAQEEKEDELASHLSTEASEDVLLLVAERIAAAERRAPSRPHPHLPHTGLSGKVVRRLARPVDAVWDAVENRAVGGPKPLPHEKPGVFWQYLLGDPRFPDEPADENRHNEPGDR
ncbi:hypothetical protein J2S40_002969 [Nocardioides luteus]|uniref:Hemerythrin-like domain-containing protein n=1 Tax=Nocardioides luteus TaxID=1844 RepID=A0ABQ5SW08_9ACTN|nr:hypothetical protein [Nocardioides luteus]MDR7311911.1 hypothetical protein [Nocardioides luteus]GGR67209.1 hypothetical protein GCM10010197_38450 [Nocardioides luteus]GLJ68154.1 hypothetical protein GCM10017579_21900 [Nocardioides luteus]